MIQKSIDLDLCDKCGECEKICFASRVIQMNDQGFPEFADDPKCILCGHCLAVCPQRAISFTDMGLAPEYMLAPAKPISDDPEMLLFSQRSERFFQNKIVARAKIQKVVEAMMRSPSGGNEQNRFYYILDSEDKINIFESKVAAHYKKFEGITKNPLVFSALVNNLAKAYMERLEIPEPYSKADVAKYRSICRETFGKGIQPKDFSYCLHAPVVIIVTSADKKLSMHNDFFRGDVRLALAYGSLMASIQGLGSCMLGLCEIAMNRDKAIGKMFNIPKNEKIQGLLALGYGESKWVQIPLRGPSKVSWL